MQILQSREFYQAVARAEKVLTFVEDSQTLLGQGAQVAFNLLSGRHFGEHIRRGGPAGTWSQTVKGLKCKYQNLEGNPLLSWEPVQLARPSWKI